MNKRALFSDESSEYRIPAEPEINQPVTIRFRTAAGDVDHVWLIHRGVRLKMEKSFSYGVFDYYSLTIPLRESRYAYYFKIVKGEQVCYYTKVGVSDEPYLECRFWILPGMKTPQWAKGAVFYQIFTDRFCNGDPTNDVVNDEYAYIDGCHVKKIDDWYQPPSSMDVRNFYGGDLKGILDKLDYLQDLGVEALYLNPIFVSPSNHKYDIQDYDNVDPHLGVILEDCDGVLEEDETAADNRQSDKYIRRVTTERNLKASNELFARLTEEAHLRGMFVVIDGVFNHCGSFNKWMDRERIYEGQEGYAPGAYVSADSPYRDFFQFYEDQWPYNAAYDGWWSHDTLPKLNYEQSANLADYIMGIARKWVSPPYSADGWRLDVAADLGHSEEYNHRFWREFRRNVKKANPEAVIIAEHYGSPVAWLQGGEWDTVMNYDAFMEPVSWFLTGMEKHSDHYEEGLLNNAEAFFHAMVWNMNAFHQSSLLTAMNELSNHDHSRFLTRTNHKVGRLGDLTSEEADEDVNLGVFREAVMIQMTWPGAPTIYYGDEAGLCGFTDPDNRRTYPWGRENHELIEFHRSLIYIRKNNEALRTGSWKPLTAEYGVIAYGRFVGENILIVALNNNASEKTVKIPVWEVGVEDGDEMERLMLTDENGYNVGRICFEAHDGMIQLQLGAYSSILLRRCAEI